MTRFLFQYIDSTLNENNPSQFSKIVLDSYKDAEFFFFFVFFMKIQSYPSVIERPFRIFTP